jgi:hypothetical protein
MVFLLSLAISICGHNLAYARLMGKKAQLATQLDRLGETILCPS